MTYYRLIVVLSLLLALASCSTRQVREDFAGSTEQRLTSHSINQIMEKLPEEDFVFLADQPVFLECFFLKEIEPLAYARRRLEMTLLEKYRCRLMSDPAEAKFVLTVFFTSIGTDFDKTGISTPDLVLPGMGGPMSIDILALEMYHGITEFYYYIRDADNRVVVRGEMLKKVVRNDTLLLPLITIPINTMR
ncbi:hypothetical protein [Desulfosudis oleivorans]|uniref:Lipoprotein n=1 Tax=Desulfosudis oleivorans (strain DSM 6200 / JCM 39069 / Hxd3) TaxID=96561 RepID=A9A017_DESOH|nr:hypothetical protein [Desulfosudis oleivorans]ABW67417.1 hypothetical protein Dole_1613 [Desulfosudis oleivorans Hxd3]